METSRSLCEAFAGSGAAYSDGCRDSCVLEKAESLAAEGLCTVISSKTKRLKRIKPGFFNPPKGRPICVPGFHWMGLMLAGMSGVPLLASLQWWTTRGSCATTEREVARTMLWYAQRTWGRLLLHIFDQGFAGFPWLSILVESHVRFLAAPGKPTIISVICKEGRKVRGI